MRQGCVGGQCGAGGLACGARLCALMLRGTGTRAGAASWGCFEARGRGDGRCAATCAVRERCKRMRRERCNRLRRRGRMRSRVLCGAMGERRRRGTTPKTPCVSMGDRAKKNPGASEKRHNLPARGNASGGLCRLSEALTPRERRFAPRIEKTDTRKRIARERAAFPREDLRNAAAFPPRISRFYENKNCSQEMS